MVTVCIPTYNGSEFIEKTINCVLSQNYRNIEIIVVDDCSNDDTVSKLQQFSKSGFKILVNDKNVGFCKSVNRGLKEAKGDFFIVMGQDDLIQEDHIYEMIKSFDLNTSIVYCDFDYIDRNDVVFDNNNHCRQREIYEKDFMYSNVIPSCGLVMKTDALRKIGGYPENDNFPNYGEYYTWIRMSEQGKILFNKHVRSKYRRHDSNMTNNFENKKIKVRLEDYFNSCRMLLLKSVHISFMDKIKVLLYMIYRFIKVRIELLWN